MPCCVQGGHDVDMWATQSHGWQWSESSNLQHERRDSRSHQIFTSTTARKSSLAILHCISRPDGYNRCLLGVWLGKISLRLHDVARVAVMDITSWEKHKTKEKNHCNISPKVHIFNVHSVMFCFDGSQTPQLILFRVAWTAFDPPPAHTHFTSSPISCLYHPLYHPHSLPTHNLLTTRRSDSTGGGGRGEEKEKGG